MLPYPSPPPCLPIPCIVILPTISLCRSHKKKATSIAPFILLWLSSVGLGNPGSKIASDEIQVSPTFEQTSQKKNEYQAPGWGSGSYRLLARVRQPHTRAALPAETHKDSSREAFYPPKRVRVWAAAPAPMVPAPWSLLQS